MKTFTDEYQKQLQMKHERHKTFGSKSSRWSGRVLKIIEENKIESVLDYGCGKGSLVNGLLCAGINVTGYDPGVLQFSNKPEKQFDLVTSTDVLEHIEPEILENVLEEISQMSLKAAFLVVSTRKAKNKLPDGRNAHLIVEKENWWRLKLKEHFKEVIWKAPMNSSESVFLCLK